RAIRIWETPPAPESSCGRSAGWPSTSSPSPAGIEPSTSCVKLPATVQGESHAATEIRTGRGKSGVHPVAARARPGGPDRLEGGAGQDPEQRAVRLHGRAGEVQLRPHADRGP